MKSASVWVAVAVAAGVGGAGVSRGDLVLRSDGTVIEGKIISRSASGLTVQPEELDSASAVQMPAAAVREVVVVDEHGARLESAKGTDEPVVRKDPEWQMPKPPEAPPVKAEHGDPGYYVIPLHGVVGQTMVADALEKSLADAQKRQPTVVILDIESPGGSVGEAQDMIKVLHHYNKDLRIVALAGEDLSAAAITTLSVKEIYMKPTGEIGAATAYDASNPGMPADISAKMQSAWKAIARSSAEEGGHEPLLADAMIDNHMQLSLTTGPDGKKVVSEGTSGEELVRSGQILTLTDKEAVHCGLAAGEAEDAKDLGAQLGFKGWKEIPGLGALLADYLPRRHEAYEKQSADLEQAFKNHLDEAIREEPTDNAVLGRVVTGPANPQPGIGPQRIGAPRGPAPGRGGFGGGGFGPGGLSRPAVPQAPRIVTEAARVDSPQSRAKWQSQSLATVMAMHGMEEVLGDQILLARVYGENSEADEFQKALEEVSGIRAQIYDDRNKYINATVAATQPARGGSAAGAPGGGLGGVSTAPAGGTLVTARGDESGESSAPTKTDQLGGKGGSPFVRGDAENRMMLGVAYTMGSWAGKPVIRRVDPVYEKPGSGAGAGAGGDAGSRITVMAKTGYVVGGMNVVTEDNVEAFQVEFFRLRDGRPDPSDAYSSDWQGAPGDRAQARELAGHGEKVVGIFGRQGLNQDAMGLLIVPVGK